MKSSYLISSVALLFFSAVSSAQGVDRSKQKTGPGITKGYYSIGDNYKKNYVSVWPSPDTVVVPEVTKGYYSSGSNNEKLPKKSGWFRKNNTRPVITKGYYSIGDNAKKLYGKDQ